MSEKEQDPLRPRSYQELKTKGGILKSAFLEKLYYPLAAFSGAGLGAFAAGCAYAIDEYILFWPVYQDKVGVGTILSVGFGIVFNLWNAQQSRLSKS